MTDKLTLTYWHTTCGDGCCDDWGVDLHINDELVPLNFQEEADALCWYLHEKHGVQCERISVYDGVED